MMKTIFTALLATIILMAGAPGQAADDSVTIGYQLIFNPWKVAMVRGSVEEATGYDIEWRRFDSPGKLLPAVASGEVAIALLGSTGVATAMTNDLGVELIWIAEAIDEAEAMVVRDGAGIETPEDLRGKRIGVPFVSTTHFHTLFALEHFGIDPSEVEILNMPPNTIAAAWERGDIDAAFVWDPALSRIRKTGTVLITSGELGRLGKPTFDGLIANSDWAAANPEFMTGFIGVLAATDAEYRDNPDSWTPDSEPVQAIVSLVGGNAEDVPGVLALYGFPSLEEQVSCVWMGCGPDGGAAAALLATARFLEEQKKIPRALEDYSPFINAKWAEQALERQAR